MAEQFKPSDDPMGVPAEALEYKPAPVYGDKLKLEVQPGYNAEVERYEEIFKHFGGEEMARGKTCYVYTINVDTDMIEYEGVPSATPRRYSQFKLLFDLLCKKGLNMPDGFVFPEQTVKSYFDESIRDERLAKFQAILNVAVADPTLRTDDWLRKFVGVDIKSKK